MKKNVHSKDLETIQMTTNKRTDKYFNWYIYTIEDHLAVEWDDWTAATQVSMVASQKHSIEWEKESHSKRGKKASMDSFMKRSKTGKTECILFSKHMKAENENKTLRHDSG